MAHFIRKTTEEFIAEAKIKHDDKYDYSQTVYEDSKQKVKIICPEHGVFEKIPNSHLMGQGCPKCGRANAGKLTRKRRITSNETMIQNWKEKWPDYEVIEVYRDEKSIPWIKAVCPKHGEFSVRYFTSIKDGTKYPCLQCFKDSMNNTKSEFVAKAVEIHGDKYNYDKFEYVNNKVHGLVGCNTCKTEWMVRPDAHIYSESGCPNCNPWITNHVPNYYRKHNVADRKCFIYLIRASYLGADFLKIGITQNSTYDRFRHMPPGFDYIEIFVHEGTFFELYEIEQELISKYSNYQYIHDVKFSGYTECFKINCLEQLKSSLAEMLVVKSS